MCVCVCVCVFSYGRLKLLGQFSHSIFVIFVSIFVLTDVIHRMADAPKVAGGYVLTATIIGFLVNAFDRYYFFVFTNGMLDWRALSVCLVSLTCCCV
jgi:Co/Zn/Cd efflux system component